MENKTNKNIKLDYLSKFDFKNVNFDEFVSKKDFLKIQFEPIYFKLNYYDRELLKQAEYQLVNFKPNNDKINLKYLDFITIVKIDSDERLKNLEQTIKHLNIFFDNKIIIGEYDIKSKINFPGNYEKILIKPKDDKFLKHYAANKIYENFNNKLIFHFDCDVIFDPKGIIDCYNTLIENNLQFGMPFNGRAVWLNKEASNNFKKNKVLPKIWKHYYKIENTLDDEFEEYCPPNKLQIKHPGFCYMVNFDIFKQLGLENPKMTGHGGDDLERIIRFLKFDYGIYWSDYFCYHLWHERELNNNWYSNYKNLDNLKALYDTIKMSNKELEKEISTWKKYS